MARQPKVQGTATPSPGNGAIKMVKDRVGDGAPGISDGQGNTLYVGDVVELPRDVCDILIAKGFAEPADSSSYAAAKKRAVVIETENRQADQKARATAQQSAFDEAPAEVRALAQEHGDEVVHLWQSGETIEDILKAYGK